MSGSDMSMQRRHFDVVSHVHGCFECPDAVERHGAPVCNQMPECRLQVADYARYMDDSIMLAPDRATGLQWLQAIREHLAVLRLEISHYSLQPIARGADFVGHRTRRTGRVVRPSLISAIRSDARHGRLTSLISRIAMTLRTQSFTHVIHYLQEQHHALFDRLPKSFRCRHHPSAAPAAA